MPAHLDPPKAEVWGLRWEQGRLGPKEREHPNGSAGGAAPLHPGVGGDSWGSWKPGRGRPKRPG